MSPALEVRALPLHKELTGHLCPIQPKHKISFKTASTRSWPISETKHATIQRHQSLETVLIRSRDDDLKDKTSWVHGCYLMQSESAVEQRSSNSDLRHTSPQLTLTSGRDEGQKRTAKNTTHKKEKPSLEVHTDNDSSSDQSQIMKRMPSVKLEKHSLKEKNHGRELIKDCCNLQNKSKLDSGYEEKFKAKSNWYPEAKTFNKLHSASTSEHGQGEYKCRRSNLFGEDGEQCPSVPQTRSIPAKTNRLLLSSNQTIYRMADKSKEDCTDMKALNNLWPKNKHCEGRGIETASVPDKCESNHSCGYSSRVAKLMMSSVCLASHQSKAASQQLEHLFFSPMQRSLLSLQNPLKHTDKSYSSSKATSHCTNNNFAIPTGITLEKDDSAFMKPLLVAHIDGQNEMVDEKKNDDSFKSSCRSHPSSQHPFLESQRNWKSESDSLLDNDFSSNDPESSWKINNMSNMSISDEHDTDSLDNYQTKLCEWKYEQNSLAQKSSEEAANEVTGIGNINQPYKRPSLSYSDQHHLMAASVEEITPVKKGNCLSSETKCLMTTGTNQHTDVNKTETKGIDSVYHLPNRAILRKTESPSPQHRPSGQDKVLSAKSMPTSDISSSVKKDEDETMYDSDSSNKSGYIPVRKRGGKMCGTMRCKNGSSSSGNSPATGKVWKSTTARSEIQKRLDEMESIRLERSEKRDSGSKTSKSRKTGIVSEEKDASHIMKRKSHRISKSKTPQLQDKNMNSRTSKRKPERELQVVEKDTNSKAMKSSVSQGSEKKHKKARMILPVTRTEQLDKTSGLVKQVSKAFVYSDGLTSLQQLDEKFSEDPGLTLLREEPPAVGRQTLASRGLDGLFHATSHVGGIWQAIFSET